MERQKDNISAGLDALPGGGGVGPSELSLCGNGARCSRIGFPVRPSPSMLGHLSEVHRLAEKTAKSGISMHRFSHQDVTTETLTVKTKKKAEVQIPLNRNAMEILERRKGYNLNAKYVFNRLPEDFDLSNQNKLFMKRNAQDKGVNRILATVGRNAKLPIKLTMHVARHSFAVTSINSGMSVYMLSKLLGHSSIAATEKTYAKFLKEKVNADMQVLEGFNF